MCDKASPSTSCRSPVLKSPKTGGTKWASEGALEMSTGELPRCAVRLVCWRLAPLLRGRRCPLTVCHLPAGRRSCDFLRSKGIGVPSHYNIALSPGYPLIQERADKGYGGGAPASIFSNVADALLESDIQSPQGIYPCPSYFVSEIGLTLCPNMHQKN